MLWFMKPGISHDVLGFLPGFWDENDPDGPVQQAHKNYQHGGGWFPTVSFHIRGNAPSLTLEYPEDPPLEAIAFAEFRETHYIVVFPYGWVCIWDKASGTGQVARMD